MDEPEICSKACCSAMVFLLIGTTIIDFGLSGCHECKHWSSSCSVSGEWKPVKYRNMIIIMMRYYRSLGFGIPSRIEQLFLWCLRACSSARQRCRWKVLKCSLLLGNGLDCNPVNMQTVLNLSSHLLNLALCLAAPSDVPSAGKSYLWECTLDSCLLTLPSACEPLPVCRN